ncbi:MAG: GNAT family N-acetyltransferase [Candidatus Peregrinibacteria bacterium]|nr:GNAT family N-acetyltransferase [Candidatus Peregrinibacteria bacterium]
MKHTKIRFAEEQDAPAIAKIHVGTWQHAYRGQVPDAYLDNLPQSIEKRAEKWKETIGRKQRGLRVFVAEVDQAIVGFCIVNPCRDDDMDTKTGEVGAIYVDADFIGKGAGSALMEAGLNFLKEEGFEKATLWVLTSHNKSREWYEKKGWKLDGKQKTEERGDMKLNEIRYIISLI